MKKIGQFYKRFSGYCGHCGNGETTLEIGPTPTRLVQNVVKGYCASCGCLLALEHATTENHQPSAQELIDQRALGYAEGQVRSQP